MVKGRIGLVAALIAPFFWVITLGGSASAGTTTGNTKPYTVSVTSSVGAGEQSTISVTITNEDQLQTLGSVNLTLPTGGYVLPDAGPTPISNNWGASASVQVTGGTVELRGLSLPYDTPLTVPVTAYDSCADATGTWSSVAKQANDFSGPPGNTFTLDPSTPPLTTTTNGSCGLEFTVQPNSAQVNTPISDTAFTPPGGSAQPIQVQIVDDEVTPVAINPSDASANTQITVTIPNTGANPVSLHATSGAASFSTLEVPVADQIDPSTGLANTDQMVANATASVGGVYTDMTSGTSAAFTVWQAGTLCQKVDKSCGVTTGNTSQNVDTSVSGTPGAAGVNILEASQGVQSISCGDLYLHAPVSSTFESTGSFGNLQATITIAGGALLGPPSKWEICFEDPTYGFTSLSGALIPAGSSGYLATCKQTGGAVPCVGSISKNKQGAIVEVLNIPPGDPCTW